MLSAGPENPLPGGGSVRPCKTGVYGKKEGLEGGEGGL